MEYDNSVKKALEISSPSPFEIHKESSLRKILLIKKMTGNPAKHSSIKYKVRKKSTSFQGFWVHRPLRKKK
jgi:hypothetical protein